MGVIRYGHKSQKMRGMTGEEVQTLQNFWELEEQLGIRKRPEDNLLASIPAIRTKPSQPDKGGNEATANNQHEKVNRDNRENDCIGEENGQ